MEYEHSKNVFPGIDSWIQQIGKRISPANPRAKFLFFRGPDMPCEATLLMTALAFRPRDLNYNELQEFPVAIRTLGRLQEL